MKKERVFALLLVVLLCFNSLPVHVTAAETPASDFGYVQNSDGTLTIESYTGRNSIVVIPEKMEGRVVTTITPNAFNSDWNKKNTEATSITLPSGLRYIREEPSADNDNTFLCKSLVSIHVNSANPTFSSQDGVLFNKNKTTLHCFPQAKATEVYTVPSSVIKIGSSAFANSNVSALKIPDSVLTIGQYAFMSSKLYQIAIGSGVTKISENAFTYCGGLKSITVSSANQNYTAVNGVLYNKAKTVLLRYTEKTPQTAFSIPGSVNRVVEQAFQGCNALADLTFPKDKALDFGDFALQGTKWYGMQKNGVVYAGRAAYSFKGSMPLFYHMKVKEGTLAVANYAFAHQRNLWRVTLPEGVQSIGRRAFVYTDQLVSAELPQSLKTIADEAFAYTGLTSLHIPGGVRTIGKEAFFAAKRLKTLTLSQGLVSIGALAFYNAAMNSVVFPASLRSIGDSAFCGCQYLSSVTFAEGLTSIGEWAFAHTALAEVTFPNTLSEISPYSFYYYKNILKKVTIPAGVTSIEYWAFSNVEGITISGYKNTTAESFAKQYGAKFVALTPIAVTGIKLNSSSTKGELGVGESKQLGVKFTPADATYRKISWKSSNGAVASVSATGLVKANATGTAKITASSTNGKTATYTVTVKKAPSSVALNYSKATIGVGEKTLDLNSTVNSGAASNKRSYTTSNSAVATVDANGVVTGKKVGTATITVTTYNGRTAKCVVTVRSAPSSITLNYKSKTLSKGGKVDLNSSVNSGAGAFLRKYSSNNTKVATVDVNGIVTAKAAGKATITVKTFNGRSATCLITVK